MKLYSPHYDIDNMNIAVAGWSGLVIALCVATFGLPFCSAALVAALMFICGIVSRMYLIQGERYNDQLQFDRYDLPSCVYMLAQELKKVKTEVKIDKRLTGSHEIDEQLQEIIYFIMRDHVYPWYDQVSDDDEFSTQVRLAVQKVIVSFSNRMKEVDWTVYLTTTLVDAAATHVRLYRQSKTKPATTLQDAFFDLELQTEGICRDHVSTNATHQRCFLQELTEVIMFLLAPEPEFHCRPVRLIIREMIVNVVLMPIITRLSDPDYINRLIVWLCRDFPVTSDVFLTVLRVTDSLDEMAAIKELLNREILSLRCRDGGGESEALVKQQLSSLLYVEKIVDIQTNRLQEGTTDYTGPSIDYYKMLGCNTAKLFQLPLDVVIKNNIALSYFMDYMTSIGQQNYLFLYLNIEGWKVSTEQELGETGSGHNSIEGSCATAMKSGNVAGESPLLAEQYSQTRQAHDRVRHAASSIFEHYLADKGASRVKIDENEIKKLLVRIRTEKPNESWFDQVQALAFDKMQEEVVGFRSWPGYVRLLAELDLLREGSKSDDDDSRSLDELSLGSDSHSLTDYSHVTGGGNIENELETSAGASPVHTSSDSRPLGPFTLSAEIIETGIVQEKGKTFGIYALSVTKKYENGHKESWHVYRRYSDFYELYQKIKEKFSEVSKASFPGKKTFHNMERKTLERRMIQLNTWLSAVTRPPLLAAKPGLLPLLLTFLHPGDYDNKPHSHFARTLDSLFRVSMQAVRTVPESVLSSVDGVVDGLTRVLQVRTAKDPPSSSTATRLSSSSSIDTETGDNIPLRILLLLMTEVFEVKASNQWLRRRVVTLLRQILRTMFGDIVNKRIVDHVSLLTSPSHVSRYLKAFKDAFWPNGMRAEPYADRDHSAKMRTRVAAKAALLSSLSDELKRILGSETSRYGMLNVFSLLQIDALNTRLLFVLIEGTLSTLFGPRALEPALTKLHAKSERFQRSESQSSAN